MCTVLNKFIRRNVRSQFNVSLMVSNTPVCVSFLVTEVFLMQKYKVIVVIHEFYNLFFHKKGRKNFKAFYFLKDAQLKSITMDTVEKYLKTLPARKLK